MNQIISKDGTPIAFDQSGQGPALILVTGALTTRADWVPLAACLAPDFSVFACTRKERLTARNGSGYLSVELRDRTGAIAARAFREQQAQR